jgi:hypothetical protein
MLRSRIVWVDDRQPMIVRLDVRAKSPLAVSRRFRQFSWNPLPGPLPVLLEDFAVAKGLGERS